jgi:glycine/D-amino acid oxidase-like deaminating enzyme/nitrite reductase/ring-hydroxylating ferredoxin subunit
MSGSVWLDTAPDAPEHPRLTRDVEADVCVVGGGIVGVTTALLLHEAGVRVVLVEANRVGHGVTGHTTAKVSSQHGLKYAQLRSRHGAEAARLYGTANQEALEWIAARVARDGIECDFRRRSAFVYGDDRAQIDDEARAAQEAGLPATRVDATPLPYAVGAAVRFDDQAELHAQKYLLALAGRLPEIYEQTHAVQVGGAVRTPGGMVHARHTIVATHFPFPDRSLAFARVHPQRSYAIACRIAGTPPDGMFISADQPTRSIRAIPLDGDELLMVGGEGHKPGTGGDTTEHYAALEAFADEHWDVRSVDYRWSAQDNTTDDGLPFVGRLTPWEPSVLMATGLAKWGFTNGTAAAFVLRDLVLGRETPEAKLFDPTRLNARAALPSLLKENAQVAARFVGDRVSKAGRRDIDDLQPGEGDIVRLNGEKVAGFRDDDGSLTAVSAVCTHLGCQVNFNRAERSWDCPCHGSRFAVDGSVLQGPAVHRLERKPL